MFIDDSGEVCPEATNDPRFRYASITGVIFETSYLIETFEKSFSALKERHFGLTDKGRPPILHRRVMKKFGGPFECLKDEGRRAAWLANCFRMYETANYTVVTVCVDKIAFYYYHPSFDGNFYKMLVFNAIERYFYFLKSLSATGDIVVEALNKDHDAAISSYYRSAYDGGTEHINASLLQKHLSSREIKIDPKKNDVAGLQMADLLAAPSRTHCRALYTDTKDYNEIDKKISEILESLKYYRSDSGNPHGYGRIWRPQKR